MGGREQALKCSRCFSEEPMGKWGRNRKEIYGVLEPPVKIKCGAKTGFSRLIVFLTAAACQSFLRAY